MKLGPDETARQMDRFQEALRRSGVKATHQRLEIFREVVGAPGHPDAETVFKGVRQRMPTVSLDTVYRTLHLFVALGLIGTLGPGRERTRFDADTRPHHHFVCTRCGLIQDVHSREFEGLKAPAAVTRLGHVETIQVEFRGLCSRCSRRKKGSDSDRQTGQRE